MRIFNSIKNIFYSYLSMIPQMFLNFILRYFFIKYLGEEYLGANGLFSNILTILSFAELGIGSAITFSLYKPLAEKDEEKISSLVYLYKKCYFVIAIVVLLGGLCFIPFLPVVTNGSTLPKLKLIYILTLLNTVISYLNADKQSLITADQKRYIVSGTRNILISIQYIFQIIFLILTSNYIIYLEIQIVFQIVLILALEFYTRRNYPFIYKMKAKKISDVEKNNILKNIRAMFMHQVGNILVDNTDNILISTYVGLVQVGIYSNYLLFINALKMAFAQISNATQSSVGNLLSEVNDVEYSFKVFKRMDFMNNMIYWISSVYLFCLLDTAVMIISRNNYNSISILAVIIINFYINGLRITANQFRNASGTFWNDRYKPIIESIVNIVFSLVLVQYYGVFGVIFATIICRLFVTLPFEQFVVFKHVFNKSFISYYLTTCMRLLLILVIGCLSNYVLSIINVNTSIIVSVMIGFALATIISLVFLLVNWNREEFNFFLELIKKYLNFGIKRIKKN